MDAASLHCSVGLVRYVLAFLSIRTVFFSSVRRSVTCLSKHENLHLTELTVGEIERNKRADRVKNRQTDWLTKRKSIRQFYKFRSRP